MSKKTWKDHLLASGLPLEHSVVNILRKAGVNNPTDYKYDRLTEDGVVAQFQIDVFANHIYLEQNLWLEIFVECKYRHPGVQWYFMPESFESFIPPKFSNVFLTLDALAGGRRVNEAAINKWAGYYDICGRGIEILAHDSNPKSIEQAIQQLRYAIVNKSGDALLHQVDDMRGREPKPIFVMVPIIVTTAELWRVKPGLTITDIWTASEPEEIAEKKELLVVHKDVEYRLFRHNESVYNRYLDDGARQKMRERLVGHWLPDPTEYLGFLSANYPSLFMVIHLDRFEKALANLLAFFEQPGMIVEA